MIVVDCSHVQELEYEQFPFKCRHCHGYGNFAISCKKKDDEEATKEQGEQWTQVQKTSAAKQGNNSKEKEHKGGQVVIPLDKKSMKLG